MMECGSEGTLRSSQRRAVQPSQRVWSFGIFIKHAVACHIVSSIVCECLSINPLPPITAGSGVEDEGRHLILIAIINIVDEIIVKISHSHSLICELLNFSEFCASERESISKEPQIAKKT